MTAAPPFSWAFLSGIEANHTGTGRFMQHLQAAVLRRKRIDGTIIYSPAGQSLSADALGMLARVPHLVVFHPQMLGVRQSEALLTQRVAAGLTTHLYMLDNFFFCLRSYNHLDAEAAPCLRCVGEGNGTNAATNGCRPWPAADPATGAFIAGLHPLVRAKQLRLFAQNARQMDLARRHFGDAAEIAYAGLWCADWTAYVDAFCAKDSAEGDTADAPSAYDVVYHGSRDMAKGIGWVLAVAARTPELRYLVPVDRGAVNFTGPPNVTIAAMRWEGGLHEAVRDAKLALAPSLWSSPCEGALIKNIVIARAAGVVDIPTAFSSEIPADVLLKLPQDPAAAATAIRAALTDRWRPDAGARSRWVRVFRAANEPVAERLLP